jgi:hypothetical protein
MEFIRPVVEERSATMEEFGEDWDDKPVRLFTSFNVDVIAYAGEQNDMLMWFMNEAKGGERSLEGFARRLLVVNFVAIHTTSLVSHTDLFVIYYLKVHADVYKSIILSSFQSGIYRTPPPRC